MDLLPFDEYVRSLPRKRMSAGILFRSADGRVLLVEPSYKPHWDIPGGSVDADEAPWTTAVRETREEIGLDRPLGRLLVIDHIGSADRVGEGIAFIFDGGIVADAEVEALTISDPEILSAGLYSLGEATEKLKGALADRLAVAVEVASTGELALTEDGKRVAR